MADDDDVLAANARFYTVFAAKDIAAMTALWARRARVACIHPGWQPLLGRDAVLASWREILSGDGAPPIRCGDAVAHVYGDAAFVICVEHIRMVELIATNIFVKEDGEWRMTHHHASGVTQSPAVARDDEDDTPESGSGFLH